MATYPLKVMMTPQINKCLFFSQIPQYVIEYETRTFEADLHVRFHTSNSREQMIRTYLWPALREGKCGPCIHKAVVIT